MAKPYAFWTPPKKTAILPPDYSVLTNTTTITSTDPSLQKKWRPQKTLIRPGVSLATRFLSPAIHSNPNPSPQIIPRLPELIPPPRFFPPVFIPQSYATTHLHFVLQQNDAESATKLSCGGFPYPSGLPSLPFFLPEDEFQFAREDSTVESMLLLPKRTYQPSNIRRRRTHGFFARKATKGGRIVIARRIAKGRARISA